VALLSKTVNSYVSANQGYANAPLRAEANHVLGWEKFTIVDAGGGWVALKSNANGRYVSADLSNGGALEAGWATSIQGWEKFKFVSSGDGWYGIQAYANGLYASADRGQAGTPLRATWATAINGWEKFQCDSAVPAASNVVGYYAETWESWNQPPAGANVGIAFSGEIDVDKALSTSAGKLSQLSGARYISLGGGNYAGRWDAYRLDAITSALYAGRFYDYSGIVYDVEEGDAGLAGRFQASFAAAKAMGKTVLVTISHSAPYGVSDAAALMQAFVRDPNIDYISPQLYSSGLEAQNEYGTLAGVGWGSYYGMRAQLVPSIVKASYYPSAQQFFASQGLTTTGFIQWNNK